jgi:peptidoglycan/xylan/chitin deacetylase (PgdA/CDA1 family)
MAVSIAKNRLVIVATVSSIIVALVANTSYANLNKKPNIDGFAYWHGDPSQPKIALTFDDGPNEPYTSEILDILKKYNIKATFFVLGKNVERYPDAARRIIKEGHVIGNHTYTHPYMLIKLKTGIKYEIQKTEQAIVSATNVKPHLFRSPYGLDSLWMYHAAKDLGYITIEWSVTGNNGGREIKPEKIVDDVLKYTEDGSIILLHDGNRLIQHFDRSHLVKALPLIIESLQKKGYQFVTVPVLLGTED